jgi:cell wall-associated NlpC family hydrolase
MRSRNEYTDTGDVRVVNILRAPLLASMLIASCAALLPAQAVKTIWAKPAKAPEAASVPARVVASAMSYLGVPYVSAGDSREGMDCSGLVYRVYQESTGSALSRSVVALYRGTLPAGAPLHIGDLLFFDTEKLPPSLPTHVGIYVGDGRIVHAA